MWKAGAFIFSFILCLNFLSKAQQTDEQFSLTVKYLLSLPEGYLADTSKKWPLMIFLHGSGQSGDDLQKVKAHGPPKLIEQGKKFPFIVVSPQAKAGLGWQPEILDHLLRSLKKQYRVDNDRIYLTGLSMGGFGTWNWAIKNPWNFAALVPICGGGDTAEVTKLKNIPVWCFHGGKDNVVLPKESIRMIESLKKVNSKARLTIYPEADHDSWTETYNNDSVYTWLLQQHKKAITAISLPAQKLREYAGFYKGPRGDTLQLQIVDDTLVAKTDDADIPVTPSGDDWFFIKDGDVQFEIQFFRNKKGKIEKFIFHGDREMEFRRLNSTRK